MKISGVQIESNLFHVRFCAALNRFAVKCLARKAIESVVIEMSDVSERIKQIKNELAGIPNGYISKKIINGKERFYLQWTEDGKLKSRYIKSAEFDRISAQVEKRKHLQEELKKLKETPEGIKESGLRRKAVRNMINITGAIMSEDTVVATVKNGEIVDCNEALVPLYLKRTKNVEGWLASRAIDTHRTNSRLLKRALRIRTADDAQTALAVNAATVTDRYWFRPEGSSAVYEDVRFKENYFDALALRGDPDAFSHKPSRTPELTNTGSFEKCWRLIDGEWWMYKSGNENEYFSELFICILGEKLGLDIAHYEMDDGYIRTRDFIDGTEFHFEPIYSLMDDNEMYNDCFESIYAISPKLAEQYLKIVWFDTICYNMDRHTGNFGFLRDVKTGKIVSMAPNFDNNIALISRGYPKNMSRENDGFIRFFREFLAENAVALQMYREMDLPVITEEMLDECLCEIPIEADRDYIKSFILNGQAEVNDIINSEDISEDESMGLSL